ncbi:hypothetical protein C2845_PM18G09150 [Panicum miliaceum]|uniref:Jacalin-type lectin domain-containing protein n=1 Tax=Panicum miliaceum TaxID=4540 RepID=A0A3L6PK48_PANMI|nr:hypothetical protein C2845_PM18G09150 [Panicum miliaceum]
MTGTSKKLESVIIYSTVDGTSYGACFANLSGTFDDNIKSLSFVTSNGDPYGPYGDPAAGKGFKIPMHKGAIVGFFAHSGAVLNSLEAYVGAQL